MTKEFEEGLKQIDMLSPNKEEVTGLVLSYEDCKNEYERAIWEEVRVRYHGDGGISHRILSSRNGRC